MAAEGVALSAGSQHAPSRPYSDDLREKVLAAYAAGKAGKGRLKELVERFGVSCGWVAKIHAMELRSGSRLRCPQKSVAGPAASVPAWCGAL